MTVAELDRWTLERNWGEARQERMAAFLAQFTIMLVDRALCRMWASMTDQCRIAPPPTGARARHHAPVQGATRPSSVFPCLPRPRDSTSHRSRRLVHGGEGAAWAPCAQGPGPVAGPRAVMGLWRIVGKASLVEG